MKTIEIRRSIESDLEALFIFQLDPKANYLAAFTSKDPTDRDAYFLKWQKLLVDEKIHMQTILMDGLIVGNVSKYEIDGKPEITYGIGKAFWGQGITTTALRKFLKIEPARPMNGAVAFDNYASQKVLEKCGFKKVGTKRAFANARGKEIEEYIYVLH